MEFGIIQTLTADIVLTDVTEWMCECVFDLCQHSLHNRSIQLCSHATTHTHTGVRGSPPSLNPYLHLKSPLCISGGHSLVVIRSFKHLAEISPRRSSSSYTHTHTHSLWPLLEEESVSVSVSVSVMLKYLHIGIIQISSSWGGTETPTPVFSWPQVCFRENTHIQTQTKVIHIYQHCPLCEFELHLVVLLCCVRLEVASTDFYFWI